MLDHPEKTANLLSALKAAVPFEVELAERILKQLRAEDVTFTVSQISPLREWWHRCLATRASRQALGEGDG